MSANSSQSEDDVAAMPDLRSPQYGFHHTVDSALYSLFRLGISTDQITIKKAGPGWQSSRIVDQEPPPEHSMGPQENVTLTAAGDGLFYRLPTGMRDEGTEFEPGIGQLLSIFDDPSEKVACYVRQGGLYFDLRPDNETGCARWIRLFGIVPEDWPVNLWYPLALLLPCLHRLAGRETGVRLALKVLLDLEVYCIRWQQRHTLLVEEALTQIGEKASRLGVDFIVGKGMEDETVMEVILGPVSLATYRQHQTSDGKFRLGQVLNLVLPCHLAWSVDWLVGNTEMAPRLDFEEENTVLGINTHLGRSTRIKEI